MMNNYARFGLLGLAAIAIGGAICRGNQAKDERREYAQQEAALRFAEVSIPAVDYRYIDGALASGDIKGARETLERLLKQQTNALIDLRAVIVENEGYSPEFRTKMGDAFDEQLRFMSEYMSRRK